VKRGDLVRLVAAGGIAAAFIATGAMRLPAAELPLEHPPVIVYSDPMLAPLIVRAKRIIHHERGLFDRAPNGQEIRVALTQYCLQGTTRRDNYVRPGIVAADPRVFPLARYVELFLGKHYLGRYLVDDTGKDIKGPRLDIWNPSCDDARRFGRHWGTAMLVVKGGSERTGRAR
jgi:3D (Asp-Asp-Asp) domain-containing protein